MADSLVDAEQTRPGDHLVTLATEHVEHVEDDDVEVDRCPACGVVLPGRGGAEHEHFQVGELAARRAGER